jgi:hypothetical protein
MNRANQLRDVFRVLRPNVDPDLSNRDVLLLAASLLELYRGGPEPIYTAHQATALEFGAWPLDRAFSDGGWKVMYHESDQEDLAIEVEMKNAIVERGMNNWYTVVRGWND